jgi:AcrR family transcriptional regulator
MLTTNKQGQALGRKGAESRARLLEAARLLLETIPVEKLTASAIARAAGLASQTYYLYFTDVDDLLFQLSREAANDTQDILDEIERPWNAATMEQHADGFVSAFYRYWDRHRTILNIRNFRADSGQAQFAQVRNDSMMPLVSSLAEQIKAAHSNSSLTQRTALARAVIIIAAIERMASRYPAGNFTHPALDGNDLKRAEADILKLMLSPQPLK